MSNEQNTKVSAPFLWLDFEVEQIKNGIVNNVAGEGLNAEIIGAPEMVSGPTGGSAVHFGGEEGRVVIPNDPRLNFELGKEFTIDFWYKLDASARLGEILFAKGDYSIQLAKTPTGVEGVCWVGNEGCFRIGALSEKESWHHITVLQKEGMLFMYLDGVQVNGVKAKAHDNAADLVIGGTKTVFHGTIDDFMMYDHAVDMKVSGLMGADGDSFSYTDENGKTITLVYRVYYPEGYDAKENKKYPLVFFLHGHGECGTNNKSQLQVLNKSNKFLDDIAEMNNAIILAPQTYCDGATGFSEWINSASGFRGKHIWDGGLGGLHIRESALPEITYTVGLQAASALLDEFLALPTVDLDRVYLSGISMGGCGAWELAARRPETFAAMVPVCGSAILSTAESFKNTAVWAIHGKLDGTVLAEGSEKMCEAIKAAGGHATYTGLEGVGHDAWIRGYTATNREGLTAAEWIFTQKKQR